MPVALEVKQLTFHYPQEKTPVLRDVSFAVSEREIFGIIGPSGCGKSTLMLALSGLIPQSIKGDMHGTVLVAGKDTRTLSMPGLSQTVQILFQSPESQLFALNVEDEITFGLENLNLPWGKIEKRLERVLRELDIEHVRHRSIEELSSGQKQRVALAAILAMEPKILLFDEPTANLDPPAVRKLGETIRALRKKHTVIIVEHNVEFLQGLADRMLLMDHGRAVLVGTPQKVFESRDYRRIMLPPHDARKMMAKLRSIPSATKRAPALRIRDLNFTYQNKAKALSDIHLDIGRGEFVGIIGLNGSGKSTLALNLIGLLRGKGRIMLDGKDMTKLDVYERTKRIGYVFQNPNYQLFEENLDDEIAFGPRNMGLNGAEVKRRVEEALHVTDLAQCRESDPHALSVGQKRRVSIASVLAMKPDIIIIDEPDTGLDHKTARNLMEYVKKLNKAGKTVIMISHSIELVAEYCDRIIGLKDGKIVTPEDVYEEYLTQ